MTLNLLHTFEAYIEKEKLFRKDDTLLVAVSGGVDSVVLCELCRLAGYKFLIAHCNFHLRGAESNSDEHFVRTLAAKYAVEIFVEDFDTAKYALQNRVSIQVAARELRYAWFNELATNLKSAKGHSVYILTAHHADDNIETVLMNFFKGTGIAGMKGILPKAGILVRPLLFAKKKALIAFADDNNLSFVEDSSNRSDKYSRNFFRNQVIPFIQEIYPGADKNITESIDRFREVELLYDQAISAHGKNLLERRGSDMYIPVLKLLKAAPLKTILFEITRKYHFTPKQTNEIVALINAESGKFVQSPTHRILKHRNWIIISALPQSLCPMTVIENEENEVLFNAGRLHFTIVDKENGEQGITESASIACLDMQAIRFPLILRKWRAGDYFYPLGMKKKKKKVSRFLIDLKLSLLDKERTWVLEMDKKIIWVVGKRIDERFKITENTRSVLKINFIAVTA